MEWGEHGNWVKLTAGDIVRGPQRVKHGLWYATGASTGSDLLLLTETKSGTPIHPDVAESAQFAKVILPPHGLIEGITLTTCAVGYVMLYFEDVHNYNAKAIHDETPAGAE